MILSRGKNTTRASTPVHVEPAVTEPSRRVGQICATTSADDGAIGVSLEFEPVAPVARDGFMEFDVTIDPSDYSYDYSKVYFSASEDEPFSEDRVICFKLRRRGERQTVRLELPASSRRTGFLRARLDALPYGPGLVESGPLRLVDSAQDDELSRAARLFAGKEWVRAQVVRSESERGIILPHYPESLSLELTAGCNLTCSHCSTHGDPDAHRLNNRRAPFNQDMLERLAHELFPHLTLVNLVGRGEPTMVAQPLWDRLVSLLDHYRVLMTCVTNGTFMRRRFTEDMMHIIDTVTVSIDGTTPYIFEQNRGGARLDTVLSNVDHFNTLRNRLPLARRPRLGFSWTLKKNNIHQFPDFIRMIKPFDPALLYVRHLFVFRDKDASESLLDSPALVNASLREAYRLLEGTRTKLDVPPLMREPA